MLQKITIKAIHNIVIDGRYRFSDHAVKRMIKRNVTRQDIENAIAAGKIIEEYPTDKYSPSCLIYGKTHNGRSLHIQVSYPPEVVIITVYEPDPGE